MPDIERLYWSLERETRRGREIETGAVEIERIAGRHHEPDHALLASELLELVDDARQHGSDDVVAMQIRSSSLM